MHLRISYLLFSILLGGTSFTFANSDYEDLFPHYVSVCKLEVRDQEKSDQHSTILYMKGACEDASSIRPRLRLCHQVDTEIQGRHTGSFLSAHQDIENGIWQFIKAPEDDKKGLCWKIPVTEYQFEAMIDYANAVNQQDTEKIHPKWSSWKNNGSHFIVNMLAAAKLMEPAQTKHVLKHIKKEVDRKQIPTVKEAYKNKLMKKSLEEFNTLGFPAGTVLDIFPIRENEDSIYTVLGTRLRSSFEKLLTAQAKLKTQPLDQFKVKNKKYRTGEFEEFYNNYSKWLEKTIAETEELKDFYVKGFIGKR